MKLDKFDPKVTYMGKENGPFLCGRCEYFHAPHCEKVAGVIDPYACCNLFSPESKIISLSRKDQ